EHRQTDGKCTASENTEIMKANDSLLPNINIHSPSLHTVHRLYSEQVHRLFNITGDKLKQNQLGFFITAADYSFLSVIRIEKSAQLHHILADDRRLISIGRFSQYIFICGHML